MNWFPGGRRRAALVAGDVLAVVLANILAVLLRFDFDLTAATIRRHRNIELLCVDLILTPLVFWGAGLYQGYLRYAGLDDLTRLTRAVMYRTVGLIVLFYALGFFGLSRAVIVISTLLLLIFAGGVRLVPRFHREFFSARRRISAPRALIIGAGDTGEALLREWRKRAEADLNPIGFLDDDVEKRGAKIHGVPVIGTSTDLATLIEASGAREVVVAIPSLPAPEMRRIFEACRAAGVRLRTVPTKGELERGAARLGQIRAVEVEDLLGRDVVALDQAILRRSLQHRRVLITGAAGSIGRELAYQVASYDPEALILLDRNENNLFYLEHDLRARYPAGRVEFLLADVTDRNRMSEIFRHHRPLVVLHAAAYKHVPLMETNPLEALKNNVLATRALAEIAAETGVERFIYISTDKAVRPTSVMGASKRLGERLVKSLARGGTRFMAVRFGNVLGSDGSVVPTFRRQIAAGGPVTVTHPDATRYFMTIQEAVQLVLTAGAMGEGGETFLLRMGEPVRIVDLARNLIELSGLQADRDISIVFTGLRPGEKLHEELQAVHEEALPTSNEKIMVLTGVEPLDEGGWGALSEMQRALANGLSEEAMGLLRVLVPDYTPLIPAANARPAKVVDISDKKRIDANA
jgi:FlaA1/EpsC-like NDP-sugar epimerase